MIDSPLVHAVRQRLHAVGYSDLRTPFRIAGVEFAFTGALRGRGGRSLDLVLLVDTTTGDFGDRNGDRVRQRVEALSRALDVTGSRYVVTVILAGAALIEGIEALAETCRVLHVEGIPLGEEGSPVNEIAERQLDDRIRVLLPLTLPGLLPEAVDGSGPALEQLVHALPPGTRPSIVEAAISASSEGEQAVMDAVARVINLALQSELGGDRS